MTDRATFTIEGYGPNGEPRSLTITVVDDEACPTCGAYWGNPDKALDYPNRPKVGSAFKCYNPGCPTAYYEDGVAVE